MRQCPNPSDETFQAESPSELTAEAASTSASLTASITAAVTPTTSLGGAATTTAASSSGISAGAAAGIGVGVGVGGILIVSAIAFFIVRWYRRKKAAERDGATVRPGARMPSDEPTPMYPGTGAGFGGSGVAAEEDAKKKDPLLATDGGAAELGHSKTVKDPSGGVGAGQETNRRSELPAQHEPAAQPLMELDNTEVERSRSTGARSQR